MEVSAHRGARAWPSLSVLLLLLAPTTALAADAASAASAPEGRPAQAFLLRDVRTADLLAKPAPALPSERFGLDLADVPGVMLPGIDVVQLLKQDEEEGRTGGLKALRIGLGRDVAPAAPDGHWFDLSDHEGGARLWAVEVGAAGALGLRLHFRDVRLPAGAELAVYSPADLPALAERRGGAAAGPGRVEIYRAGGPGEIWTATLAGERVRIEYYAPAGAAKDGAAGRELPFAVDRLQHIYRDPVAGTIAGLKGKAAGPCHNDVSCYPEWADTARAVAGIGFIGDDALYCTGQLINSQSPDLTPYWLTANHCLSTQESAASSEIFWLYQTGTCGGPAPALTSVPRSVGASLVATSDASDFTLLMIEGVVPPGLSWAGWTSAKIADGTPATAIHHPQGDFKRISFGAKGQSSACGSPNLVRINWSDGPTEPGSSGSGIFTDAKQQLFGQLFFGPSECGSETYDCYGAFASTFPRLRGFLRRGGSDDKSEQNDTCKKARGVKLGTLGGRVVKFYDPDWYTFKVPKGKTLTVTVNFFNPAGDVDLKLYPNCASDSLAASTSSTENQEKLSVFNAGNRPANVYWQVYLADDVRGYYDLVTTLE